MSGAPRPVSTRGLVEGALLAVVLVGLVVATYYVPASGLLFAFFWPVPVALLYVRYDSRVAVLAVVVSAIILSAAVGAANALDAAFLFGPLGIALGHAAKYRWSAVQALAAGAAAILVASAGTVASFWLLAGQAPGVWLSADAGAWLESLRTMGESGLLQPGQVEFVARLLAQIPWITLLFAGALGLVINYLTTRAVLARLGYSLPALQPFREWRIPAAVRGIAALALIGWFARGALPAGTALALTVVFPFAMGALVLQGLAILDHILAGRGAHAIVRVVFYLLLFTFSAAWPLVAAAAMIDIVFDLRRRLAAPAQPAASGQKEDAHESHPHAGHQDPRKKGQRRRGR